MPKDALEHLGNCIRNARNECGLTQQELADQTGKGLRHIQNIRAGEDVIKYGVRIARATKDIRAGEWVHLHNIRSVYDERSSHLDAMTGAPKDTRYE